MSKTTKSDVETLAIVLLKSFGYDYIYGRISLRIRVMFCTVCFAAVFSLIPGSGAAQEPEGGVPGKVIILYQSPAGDGLQKLAALNGNRQFSGVRAQIGSTWLVPFIRNPAAGNRVDISPLDQFFVLDYDRRIPFARVRSVLQSVAQISAVEPVYRFSFVYVPNDSLLINQHYLRQIHAPAAWDSTGGDSTIIIAIIDNGFDLTHPDLEKNYAVNPAEFKGIAGQDDDDNGFIDDVSGYDFAEDDPDPSFGDPALPAHIHGTHVAGIAAASGDNRTGIAGVAWRCKILPVKVARDDEPDSLESVKAFRGIVYAVTMGARVINLSWGRTGSPSLFEQETLNWVYRQGSMVVAGTGNNDAEEIIYPAGYHHVIGVAAVDQDDHIAGFSNFGRTADLAAPGVDIFSTVPGAGYDYLSGTSMAAPIVSGVAALIWSLHPQWSSARVMRQTVFSATAIDDLNPAFRNKLGSGRVDAENAVTQKELQSAPVNLALKNYSLIGTVNGRNIVARGSNVSVYLTFSNLSLAGSAAVQIDLHAPLEPDLIWQRQSQTIAAPADSDFTVSEPFLFTVPEQLQTDFFQLVIAYSGENIAAGSDTILLQAGEAPILFVDDGDGENSRKTVYTNILNNLTIPFAYWNPNRFGSPESSLLQNFPVILWACGDVLPVLTSSDLTALTNYLNTHGSLFLSGQDIGSDLMDPVSRNTSEEARQFYRSVLHADYLADTAGDNQIVAIPGELIKNELAFNLFRSAASLRPDLIEPLAPARSFLLYKKQQGTAGIFFSGEYKTVYTGFGLEDIGSENEKNPAESDSIRGLLLTRILNYLLPFIHQPVRDRMEPVSVISVSAEYAAGRPLPQKVNLFYSVPGDTGFIEQELNRNERIFSGQMLLSDLTGDFHYFFRIDASDYSWYFPVSGREEPFTFKVGRDDDPPALFHQPPGTVLKLSNKYTVDWLIRDNVALDSAKLFLFYRLNRNRPDSVRVQYNTFRDRFIGEILGNFSYGDTIFYYLRAEDVANPPNETVSGRYSFIIGRENFETGLRAWKIESGVWGLDSLQSHTDKYSLTTAPFTTYKNNLDGTISCRDSIDLRRANRAELQFYSRWAVENGDAGFIEIKTGDNPWVKIAGPFSGFQSRWQLVRISLQPFLGRSNCLFRFRFVSDQTQQTPLPGWWIDDIRIVQDDYISDVKESRMSHQPQHFWLSRGYPNPFRGKIGFQLTARKNEKISVSIFNLLGQRVRTLALADSRQNPQRLWWDGKNDAGRRMPAGIYILRAGSAGFRQMQKILLLR